MDERTVTAYHEAGHALMAFLKKVRIVKVSIIPSESPGALGHLISSNKIGAKPGEFLYKDKFKNRLEHFCMVGMAGMSAEYILTGVHNLEGGGQDQACIDYFLGLLTYSHREFTLYRDLLRVRTESILREKAHWKMITALAQFLLNVNPVINGRKAKEILRNS
ncbi:MAG: hypothetical protein GY757_13765, partial [bacterium]|nr:hypothetical protein [bacterium]